MRNLEPDEELSRHVPGWSPELGSRLSSAIDLLGGLRTTSKIAGASDEQIGKWRDGKAKMPFAAAISIARRAGVSLDWLAGVSSNRRAESNEGASSMVAIPVFEVTASAGHGSVALREQPSDFLWFNEAWLRQSYGVNPNDLMLLPATGESMVPTISPGALLMVNCSDTARQLADGIYVVRLEGDILVKRLQRLPGNQVRVSSDNPAYEPYTVRVDAGVDFNVLGRVVIAVDFKRL